MTAVFRGRVAASWACNACSLPTFRVDQPEGRTLAEACGHLLEFLVQVIESAGAGRRRHPLRLALIDDRTVDPRCMHRA
jgi:hypothetical protein